MRSCGRPICRWCPRAHTRRAHRLGHPNDDNVYPRKHAKDAQRNASQNPHAIVGGLGIGARFAHGIPRHDDGKRFPIAAPQCAKFLGRAKYRQSIGCAKCAKCAKCARWSSCAKRCQWPSFAKCCQWSSCAKCAQQPRNGDMRCGKSRRYRHDTSIGNHRSRFVEDTRNLIARIARRYLQYGKIERDSAPGDDYSRHARHPSRRNARSQEIEQTLQKSPDDSQRKVV